VESAATGPRGQRILFWIIILISAATVISGIVQIFAPEFVLKLVGANRDLTADHFFSIIGMFMALFGGMLLQAMRSASNQQVAVFWAGSQKIGASLAVGIGVERHVFSTLALAVASFDFISGCLIFWYWRRIHR
jgi:hypothetical protein